MWFKRHPNWTIFFSWITAIVLFNLSYFTNNEAGNTEWWMLYALGILLIVGTLTWSLNVKHRSYYNLFYLFIPFIGFLIIWDLGDSTKKKSETVTETVSKELE